jgi:hypothetical protein
MITTFGELAIGDLFRFAGGWEKGREHYVMEKIEPVHLSATMMYNSHKANGWGATRMNDDSPVERVSIEDEAVFQDFKDAIIHISRRHHDDIAKGEIDHVLSYMKRGTGT